MKKIIIILLIIILSGCGYNEYEIPEDAYINLNENVFEVYSKNNNLDLINNTNTEIISKEELLDTNTLGKHIYTLEYKYKKRKYKYDINYEVKDTTKPVFIKAPSTITILPDDTNLCTKIVYADNYDNLPTCTINGSYDTTKIGKYDKLEVIIKDSSLNENKKTFTLNVVNEIKKDNYIKPKYLYIDDIIKNYKNDNTSIGIDVSKWQGKVDFKKVKDSGIEFVIMRIGFQKNPNDKIEIDPKFKEYYKEVKENNLKVGIYVYNVATNKEEAIKVAKWVVKELGDEKLDLPIAYDWESWDNFMDYKISLHTLSESYLAFEKEIKNNGYDAMLYSSKFYLENVWNNFDKSNIWLAHYTNKTDYQGKYMLWQMTSLAKIDGITENTVDIDILYK